MKHLEFDFLTFDELKLYAQAWITDKDSKAVICLMHGIGEHSGRYEGLAKYFVKNGYCVVSFDQRGHGKSPGKRGHTPGGEAWMQDISSFIEAVKRRFGKTNYYIYGHSLGGLEVLNYILKKQIDFKGAIVTSPALKLVKYPAKLLMFLAKIFSYLYPSISLKNGLNAEDISHRADEVKDYEKDHLIHNKISAKTFVTMLDFGDYAANNAQNLNIPLLLMHGGDDKITLAKASEEFAEKAGQRCKLKIWPGLYHELHYEYEKDEILDFIVNWLNRH